MHEGSDGGVCHGGAEAQGANVALRGLKRAVVLRRFRVLLVIVVVVRCCVSRQTCRFVVLRVVVICWRGQRCCGVRSLFPVYRRVLLCVDMCYFRALERKERMRERGNEGKGNTEKEERKGKRTQRGTPRDAPKN